MTKQKSMDQDAAFLHFIVGWLRFTIAKRTLAYQPHDKFTHSQPQGSYHPLLTLELNPKYKNVHNTSAKTSFAITDELQIIAWDPDTGNIFTELTTEAASFAQGVYYMIKHIFLTNLEYTTEALYTLAKASDIEEIKPIVKPGVIKLQHAAKPQPTASWKASTKAFLNYITHGFLEHSYLLNVSHYVKNDGTEEFDLLRLDDSIHEIYQIGPMLMQISDTEESYFGRYKLKNPELKVQTRENLQWRPLTQSSSNNHIREGSLAILGITSIITQTLKLVEDSQQEWFNSPVAELHEAYGIDYFQVAWKYR